MRINKPSWFKPYNMFFAVPSADGSVFWGEIGSGPEGFKYYVFRQVGEGVSEQVHYDPMGDHGNLMLTPVGLFVNVLFGNPQQLYMIPIQGYVPFTSEKLPVDPIIIQNRLSGEDELARNQLAVLKEDVKTVTKTASDAYKIATDHIGSIHLNEATVYTIADLVVKDWWEKTGQNIDWQQALNAQFATLKDAADGKNEDVAALIKQIAGDAAVDPTLLTKAILKAIGTILLEASK